jgi:hypothetical protein
LEYIYDRINFYKNKIGSEYKMSFEIRDLNDKEVVISKNNLFDLLDEIQELREMIFAQKEVISKLANIKE